MTKFVILRHGESEWNKKNKFTGWEDVNLTENGVNEAKSAGKILKDEGFSFDVAYTSMLKRAKETLIHCLTEMNDINNVSIFEDWRLNERHYGSLQGLNKKETAKKFGNDKVLKWRRSYDISPPKLSKEDLSHPLNNKKYSFISDVVLPSSESLKNVLERFLPLWNDKILNSIKNQKKVIIVAHGNSLRALVKHIKGMTKKDIINFNIPTGIPMIFELDDKFKSTKNYYLGNAKIINEKIKQVASQGSSKKVNI